MKLKNILFLGETIAKLEKLLKKQNRTKTAITDRNKC